MEKPFFLTKTFVQILKLSSSGCFSSTLYIMLLYLQIQNSLLSPIADLQTSFPMLQPWSHVVPFTSENVSN